MAQARLARLLPIATIARGLSPIVVSLRPSPDQHHDPYDVVVIGGGIFGICVAWDAACRGLSVMLIERGDFAAGTSANCFKIVHGGLRYLQHGDVVRVRESAREFRALLRNAPHLVKPLPVLVPTYGHGMRGKEILRLALRVYDAMTFDRNLGLDDPERRIHRGRALSRVECLRLFPGLDGDGFTGGVLFYDGQMHNPHRLALAHLKSAVHAGAHAANYLEATGLLRDGRQVCGVAARDRLTARASHIPARVVVNACGPWAERLLLTSLGLRLHRPPTFSRDTYFVVRRRLTGPVAVALPARTKDPDAVLSRGPRHLFLVPWRGQTLVGVWHGVHRGDPDSVHVSEAELQQFVDEISAACPGIRLKTGEIVNSHAGLVLFGDNEDGATDLRYGHRSQIVDHAATDGIQGLLTVIGVRYTTARGVATRVVDLIGRKLGRPIPASTTAVSAVYGGDIARVADHLKRAVAERPSCVTPRTMGALVRNHGSRHVDVLTYIEDDPRLATTFGTTSVTRADVVHAARAEMAQTLDDIVLRRTDLAVGGHPGMSILAECAELAAGELGWDEARLEHELRTTAAALPPPAARPGPPPRLGRGS